MESRGGQPPRGYSGTVITQPDYSYALGLIDTTRRRTYCVRKKSFWLDPSSCSPLSRHTYTLHVSLSSSGFAFPAQDEAGRLLLVTHSWEWQWQIRPARSFRFGEWFSGFKVIC